MRPRTIDALRSECARHSAECRLRDGFVSVWRARGRETLRTGAELGLIDDRDGRLEVHPIIARELRRTAVANLGDGFSRALATALGIYRERRDWDSAFELVQGHGLDEQLAELMLDGVDEILATGRLSTLENWVRFARTRRVESHPVFTIAELEIQLRRGHYMTALTGARRAVERGADARDINYRLHLIAARAANMGSRERTPSTTSDAPEGLLRTLSEEREARWGELMCNSALERPEAHGLFDDLVASAVSTDATDQVRMADRQLSLGFRFGSVNGLANSRRVLELVDEVEDVFVRCSFLGVHGWALALGAHYDEAVATARRLDTRPRSFGSIRPYPTPTQRLRLP